MSLDCRFTTDLERASRGDARLLQEERALPWPPVASLPNLEGGAFKATPFIGLLEAVAGIDLGGRQDLEPGAVANAARQLGQFLNGLGPHGDNDEIAVPQDEEEPLSYEWIRDLTVLFEFAAGRGMALYVYK
jgi:hypothetical protein